MMKDINNKRSELIQIRVTESEKANIKGLAISKGLTVSELVLYSLMRAISEDNINKIINL